MAKKYLDLPGLNYLVSKIQTLLDLKANKDLSNVSDLDFLNKARNSGFSTSSSKIFTGTLGTNWTKDEATGVRFQIVQIDGVLESHNGTCDHDDTSINGTSDGYAAFVEEENQWLTKITNGRPVQTFDGYVRFEIFGEPNTVPIPFWMGVS